MRVSCSLLSVSVLSCSLTLCGCGNSGPGIEDGVPKDAVIEAKPDMSKMPGFNEMQEKMKKKGGARK